MKILLALFPILTFASLPNPPSFMVKTPTEKLYVVEASLVLAKTEYHGFSRG